MPMPKKLLSPEQVKDFLVRRYNNQHRNWLGGHGTWPLAVSLGVPTEKDLAQDPVGVRDWVASWASWKGAGTLSWQARQFARLGTQSLPAVLTLQSPLEVAGWAGQLRRWSTAVERHARMVEQWPQLQTGEALACEFNVLADYAPVDFERLFGLLTWLQRNPASNLYLRQLPIEGLDTKWVGPRAAVVAPLLRAIRGEGAAADFFELCGLRKPAHRLRLRVLCSELRRTVGGLCDIEAPVQEVAGLALAPSSILIVENLETGLALPDLPGTVAFMKLGLAVGALRAVPWLRERPAVYWGDIDTHGFVILDKARQVLHALESVLMDEATLLAHKPLWVPEPTQCTDQELPMLHAHEREVYQSLRSHQHGQKVRLEQERLPWAQALDVVRAALARPGS